MTTRMHPCEPIPDLSWYSTAKERHVLGIELPCSPERLFDVLEDPDAWPAWVSSITRVEWTSPRPFGVGTTRTVHVKGGLVVDEVFLAWETGKTFAFALTAVSRRIWTRMGELYAVERLGADRCRLTWTMAYEPRGAFAWLHPWIRRPMRRSLAASLTKLEALIVERSAEAEMDAGPGVEAG